MKKRTLFLSGLISVIIILLTGWIGAYSNISGLQEICFYFHLIPFGIGFSGGNTSSIIIYYLILWIVLALVMNPIIIIFDSLKNKRLILITIISICTLVFLCIVWIDYTQNKEREERILHNKNEDDVNFKSLKSGDIIFQSFYNANGIIFQDDSSFFDYKIAIISVGIHGYSVLEVSDQVQHTSLRKWIEKVGNYTVKRLINADSLLTENNIEKLEVEGQKFVSKNFDDFYCWSDSKIYGSELVWKTYKRALNIELATLEVPKKLNYNKPEQELCPNDNYISTMQIFNSDKLITVLKN
jgi:hypothetical protein